MEHLLQNLLACLKWKDDVILNETVEVDVEKLIVDIVHAPW